MWEKFIDICMVCHAHKTHNNCKLQTGPLEKLKKTQVISIEAAFGANSTQTFAHYAETVAEAARNVEEKILEATSGGDVEASGESSTVPGHVELNPGAKLQEQWISKTI